MKKKYLTSIFLLTFILIFKNINAQEDITKPQFNSISITNEFIKASDELSFIVNMTDDHSGIDYAYIAYKNADGEQDSGMIGGSIYNKWTSLGEDDYSVKNKLNEFSISGEWYISMIYIKDNTGNIYYKSYSEENSILRFSVEGETANVESNLLKKTYLIQESQNIITIHSVIEIINFEVYDLKGMKTNIRKLDHNSFELNTLPKGMYIILIKTSKGSISKKFIK